MAEIHSHILLNTYHSRINLFLSLSLSLYIYIYIYTEREVGSYEKHVNLRKHEDESQSHIFGYGGHTHGGLTQFMGGWRLLRGDRSKPPLLIGRVTEIHSRISFKIILCAAWLCSMRK